MTVVYASKGPLAGRQVDIPEDQVKAATGEDGWAIKIEPGAQLLADPGAVYDENWVIPGYTTEDLKPFTGRTKEKNDENSGQRNGNSSKTTGARTAKGADDE
jgi:hypothetical protein